MTAVSGRLQAGLQSRNIRREENQISLREGRTRSKTDIICFQVTA